MMYCNKSEPFSMHSDLTSCPASIHHHHHSLLPDWAYGMRRGMQEIVPGLFLGPFSAAQRHCHRTLSEIGITHIVCVRQDIEAHFIKPQISDGNITYLTLDIADSVTENIMRFFPRIKQFIDEVLRLNGKVLVHGNNGISRSATLVLAYIMEKYGLSSKDAIDFVKRRRGCIHPNEGFLAQLTEYEPIYRARQAQQNGETSQSGNRQKRKSDQLFETVDFDDLVQPPPSPIGGNGLYPTENSLPMNEFSTHLYRLLKGN